MAHLHPWRQTWCDIFTHHDVGASTELWIQSISQLTDLSNTCLRLDLCNHFLTWCWVHRLQWFPRCKLLLLLRGSLAAFFHGSTGALHLRYVLKVGLELLISVEPHPPSLIEVFRNFLSGFLELSSFLFLFLKHHFDMLAELDSEDTTIFLV